MDNKLGLFIRELRKEKKMTLKELAEQTGISLPQVSKIERGVHMPSVDKIEKLAIALSYDPVELIKLSGGSEKKFKFYYQINNDLRYYTLIKFDRTCQICGSKAPYAEIDVSPIKLSEYGGDPNLLENLIALCRDCFDARQKFIKKEGIESDYLIKKLNINAK